MITKDIEIEWEEKKETVTIKKMSFKERANLRAACRTIKFEGGKQMISVDQAKMEVHTLMSAIVKAPFNHNDEKIVGEIDGILGDRLYDQIERLNSPPEEKKNEAPERDKAGVLATGGSQGSDDILPAG